MATAPTLPFVSVEEYLKTDYEPHCEYLDGVLAPKALPDYIHSTFQMLLVMFFRLQRDRFQRLQGLPELHSRISPTRFRIPDIVGITHIPSDGRYPTKETPPLFTIEIASKEEPWTDLRGKLADHLAMGVGTVIIADPYNKAVLVATQNEPLHELRAPLVVNIPIPDNDNPVLQIDFDDLYRQLDQELSFT
jgi:Uma2 family endonuclease